MRYAIVYTITAANTKRHEVDAWITDVPDGSKVADVKTAVLSSGRIDEWSERGIPLANRRIMAENRIPADATSASAVTVAWHELVKVKSVQWNLRVPDVSKASWTAAAAREGLALNTWAVRVLDAAASR
jgi:hypothetical protein